MGDLIVQGLSWTMQYSNFSNGEMGDYDQKG